MAKEIKYNKATTKNLLLITESEVPGTTQVTPEVIEVIAQIAAQEVSGVYSMRGKLADVMSYLNCVTAPIVMLL